MILLPEFEFDEAKSRTNAEKHVIDFHEAQELWLDPDLLRRAARPGAEPRVLFVGEIDGRCWAVVVTYRGPAARSSRCGAADRKRWMFMDAHELDRKFDEGEEDILDYFDPDSETRPNRPQRVSVDLPEWVVENLDAEALRLGVTRQSVITLWIAERLKRES